MNEEQYIAETAAWVGGVSTLLRKLNWGGWLDQAVSVIDEVLGVLATLIPGSGPVLHVVDTLIDKVIELLDAIF